METTKALLQNKCTQSVANNRRKKMRVLFSQSKVAATRTPRFHDTMKQVIPSSTKTSYKELAKIQTLVLDALAPLTFLREAERPRVKAS